MAMPLNFVAVRHGQSEGNLAKRRSEIGDDSDYTPEFRGRHSAGYRLSTRGVIQAQKAGLILRQEFLAAGITFQLAYSSSYLRAMETAGNLELPSVEWRLNDYLTERDWGKLDSLTVRERQVQYAAFLEMQRREPFFTRPPNGESFMDLCMRIDRVFDTLHREGFDSNVLVVCHGEVMRAIDIRIRHTPKDDFRKSMNSGEVWDRIHNCEIRHYTRINPEDPRDVRPYLTWMRKVRPADEPPTRKDWEEITRRRFSNEELLAIVSKTGRMVA